MQEKNLTFEDVFNAASLPDDGQYFNFEITEYQAVKEKQWKFKNTKDVIGTISTKIDYVKRDSEMKEKMKVELQMVKDEINVFKPRNESEFEILSMLRKDTVLRKSEKIIPYDVCQINIKSLIELKTMVDDDALNTVKINGKDKICNYYLTSLNATPLLRTNFQKAVNDIYYRLTSLRKLMKEDSKGNVTVTIIGDNRTEKTVDDEEWLTLKKRLIDNKGGKQFPKKEVIDNIIYYDEVEKLFREEKENLNTEITNL